MTSEVYQQIFNISAVAMVIIQNDSLQTANKAFTELSGYNLTDLPELSFRNLIVPADLLNIIPEAFELSSFESYQKVYSFRLITHTHNVIDVRGIFSFLEWNHQPAELLQLFNSATLDSNLYETSLNIKNTAACRENDVKYEEVADSLPEVIFEMNNQGKITFTDQTAYRLFGVSEAEYQQEINVFDYVAPVEQKKMAEHIERILTGEELGISKYLLRKKDGSTFPAIIHMSRVIRDQKFIGLRGVLLDISEHKQAETQLNYLIQHDTLTGLYNRAYFETELNKRQQSKTLLGIIILDVDGLKLINDTLGHSHGDKLLKAIAEHMSINFREGDLLARVGGDEFAILLNDIDEYRINQLIGQFNSAIFEYNQTHTRVPLNISCGYVLGVGNNLSPGSLFNEADNNMRKEKLFHSQSNRSAIVQTLKKALEARDFITEGHADRLQKLVLKLTTSIGFPDNLKNDLRLFAQFHDLGKVGIPDRILFKDGPLSKKEVLEMQRHSEIGYRIAQSASELAPIAEWILHHHEWWNGNGYPLGIKGEKIPLACRLLAIVDAFDAMTNDRPYRHSLSFSEALAELKKFAGTQFDPELVNTFIEVISN